MTEQTETPNPANGAVNKKLVKVRATEPLGEMVNGEMVRVAKGETLDLEPARVKALGSLVEPAT